MVSATDIDRMDQKTTIAKKRSTYSASLVVSIVLISIFLSLFVLGFKRILRMTGNVDHTIPSIPVDSDRKSHS